jgi:hypothetical protein
MVCPAQPPETIKTSTPSRASSRRGAVAIVARPRPLIEVFAERLTVRLNRRKHHSLSAILTLSCHATRWDRWSHIIDDTEVDFGQVAELSTRIFVLDPYANRCRIAMTWTTSSNGAFGGR